MTEFKQGLGAMVGLMSVLLVGCAQPSAVEAELDTATAKSITLGPAVTTIKPGASVSFSHQVATPISAGENGSVTLTVNEGYPSGTLLLEASGGPGLDVFGAAATARKDMAAGTSHSWRVDFEAASDGVYYLNVMATTAPDGGLVESRAYAVRIDVGDWQAAQAKVSAAKPMQTLESGEPAILMEAQETIGE